MKKIAVLGGAFDPVHKGHTELVEFLLDKLKYELDGIWIMPATDHVHKPNTNLYLHRFNMCFSAFNKYKQVKVSDFETHCNGTTFELMEELRNVYKDTDFAFIIGLDNANEISKWHNYKELIKRNKFIVFNRGGYIIENNWFLKSPHIYIPDLSIDISSSFIRKLFKQGNDTLARPYLDEEVYQYIQKLDLYKI